MFKNFSNTTKIFATLIGAFILIMIILFSISGNKAPTTQVKRFMRDTASADNKVEALKTVSADLQMVEKKNATLEKNVHTLQSEHIEAITALKKQITDEMRKANTSLLAQNKTMQQEIAAMNKRPKTNNTSAYAVNGDTTTKSAFTWITDMSKQQTATSAKSNKDDNTLSSLTGSPLNINDAANSNQHSKASIKPVYTIPDNATLTGATLMTPLVGRIPIDGKLPSPYHFKVVLSANNITANGVPLPDIHGAVASGIASGDLLGSCARGDVTSITFIFNDGTISTTAVTNASSTDDSGNSLGYISTLNGNPCLPGKIHTDAAIFLGAQVGFGAVQGYAKSITGSQYMQSTNATGQTFHMLMGDANKAAAGQALSGASEAAQTWWNQRVQSSHDFVYVSNVEGHHTRKVVLNITQQIPINYDPNGRKVSYENQLQTLNTRLD